MSETLKTTVAKAKELQKELADMKKEVQKKGEKLFKEAIAFLFEENPKLQSFGWTQYTPYFNDGDTCYFGVHNDSYSISINGADPYDDDEDDEEVEEVEAEAENLTAKEKEKLRKTVSDVLQSFDDEVYEVMFGDHAEITATKKGIQVDEYNHD